MSLRSERLNDALGNELEAFQDGVLLTANKWVWEKKDEKGNILARSEDYWVGLTAEIAGQEDLGLFTVSAKNQIEAEAGFRQLRDWLGFRR